MANNVYIGSRYVPIFDGDWDATKVYEPLTIVNYNGGSYTSKRTVTAGTLPTNTNYWALTGNYNGQIAALQTQLNATDGRIESAFVSPMDFGAVDDGVTDNTQAVQDALDSGHPVYIKNGIKYNKNNLVLPSNAIIYDEWKSGYVRTITNGNETGAVNETIFEAPYHPSIIIDVNDQLNDDGVVLPSQTDILASLLFRHAGTSKWAFTSDFGRSCLIVEHFNSYRQPVVVTSSGLIVNNNEYAGTPSSAYNLCVKGNASIDAQTSVVQGFNVLDSNNDVSSTYQLIATDNDVTLYDKTGTSKKLGIVTKKGYAKFNTISGDYHTSAEIQALDVTNLEIGAMTLDITLNKLVILRSKSPVTWIDAMGTTVYTV